MKIEIINGQRVGTPTVESNYLYNESANVITDKIYLGIYADAGEWLEITEAEKQLIEATMEEEV